MTSKSELTDRLVEAAAQAMAAEKWFDSTRPSDQEVARVALAAALPVLAEAVDECGDLGPPIWDAGLEAATALIREAQP